MKALQDFLSVIQSLAPALRTVGVFNGTGIDLQKFHSRAVEVTAGAWTDGTHTITLEESDDNVSFTVVVAADLVGTLPVISSAAGQNKVHPLVDYIGAKRYVRAVLTVVGGATGAIIGVNLDRATPRYAGQVPGGLTPTF